jgi:hypothetical protein
MRYITVIWLLSIDSVIRKRMLIFLASNATKSHPSSQWYLRIVIGYHIFAQQGNANAE